MIDKLLETKKELANNWKMKMDYYQKIIDEVNPYELTEFLNANCSMNFAKGMYMALTREIQDLEKLEEPTINGYSIEEVITILNGLNLERILDIKMTMKNLSILAEKLQEDFQKTLDKSMKNMMNDLGVDKE